MAKPKRVVHGQPEPANQIGAALLAWRGTRTRPEAAALLGVSLKTYYTLESLGKTCRIGIAKRVFELTRVQLMVGSYLFVRRESSRCAQCADLPHRRPERRGSDGALVPCQCGLTWEPELIRYPELRKSAWML